MRVQLCLLVVCCVAGCARAGALPPFLTACSASDPQLSQCVERVVAAGGRQFAAGVPALGVAPLDPVQLGTVPIDNPALKLTFTDTVVSGLAGSKINSFKINTEKGKVVLDFTANVTLKAKYVMDGQVLILPIRGNGNAKIKITNLNIVVKYDYVTKDGYWVITSYKDSYKMDRAQFKFTNLFNGQKELAETTSKFLNESWSLVMQEIAPPAVEQIIKKCIDQLKNFYAAVPAAALLAA